MRPRSNHKMGIMLTDKLLYVVEFGRAVGELDQTIDELYKDILGRIELPTVESIQHFHRGATRLSDMGYYKDALMFFERFPAITDKQAIIACAISNFEAGSQA